MNRELKQAEKDHWEAHGKFMAAAKGHWTGLIGERQYHWGTDPTADTHLAELKRLNEVIDRLSAPIAKKKESKLDIDKLFGNSDESDGANWWKK